MMEAVLRRSELLDPVGRRYWPFFKGRDGARTPMQWTSTGGFTKGQPWLPYGDLSLNVADQSSADDSLLLWYRTVLSLRRKTPELRSGAQVWREDDGQILSFERKLSESSVHVTLNCAAKPLAFKPSGSVLLSSAYTEGHFGPYGVCIVRIPFGD